MEENKLFLEACKYFGLDPVKCLPNVEGVPAHHQAAMLSTAKLYIISDYVNKDFNPDYTNRNQRKWEPWIQLGSSSGSVFRLLDFDLWSTTSHCGARLCSESESNSRRIFEGAEELYKHIFVYERNNKKNYGIE